MKVEIEMKGREEMQRALRLLGPKAKEEMGNALWNEGNRILNAAKAITPFDEGTLEGSGTMSPLPEHTADGVSVTIGFGGAAKEYAVVQHEELSYHHKPPTQAKFLEKPFKEASEGMGFRIAQELWRKLK
jgi:hypothetical protein